jgi:hypothetical protein
MKSHSQAFLHRTFAISNDYDASENGRHYLATSLGCDPFHKLNTVYRSSSKSWILVSHFSKPFDSLFDGRTDSPLRRVRFNDGDPFRFYSQRVSFFACAQLGHDNSQLSPGEDHGLDWAYSGPANKPLEPPASAGSLSVTCQLIKTLPNIGASY